MAALMESGDIKTDDEANEFGKKMTTAFAEACLEPGDFPELFAAKTAELGNTTVTDAALELYNAINAIIAAKVESGDIKTDDEANEFGKKMTTAFADALFESN